MGGDQPVHLREALMLTDAPSVTQLSQVIAQATAPSFLLGAVAALRANRADEPRHR
jgi:hypothetical protein